MSLPAIIFTSSDCITLGIRAHGAILRDVNCSAYHEGLLAYLLSAECALSERFKNLETLVQIPEIGRLHGILNACGVSPKNYPPAIRRLAQSLKNKGSLSRIGPVVDIYNFASATHMLCMGAHDLSRLALPISLRLVTGDEVFIPLNSAAAETLPRGEFAYVDAENRVICRLDSLQSETTKVRPETRDILLVVEATDITPEAELDAAVRDTINTIRRFCGGRPG